MRLCICQQEQGWQVRHYAKTLLQIPLSCKSTEKPAAVEDDEEAQLRELQAALAM
jgi:hypothetical protein